VLPPSRPGMSNVSNGGRLPAVGPARFGSLPAGRFAMPKIDVAAVPKRKGAGYPPLFDAPLADRVRLQQRVHSHPGGRLGNKK
jgi:hypothetical protein